jgi:hypothetical protein
MKHLHSNATINHLLKGKNWREKNEQENRQNVSTWHDDDNDNNDNITTTITHRKQLQWLPK